MLALHQVGHSLVETGLVDREGIAVDFRGKVAPAGGGTELSGE